MYDGILHNSLEFRSAAIGSPEARSIIEAVGTMNNLHQHLTLTNPYVKNQ
jgi:hypothetical protein